MEFVSLLNYFRTSWKYAKVPAYKAATVSWQVRFFHWYGYGGYDLVLENKSLDSLKDPQKDEEDTDVLNPGKFDGFPEARAVGGRRQLS